MNEKNVIVTRGWFDERLFKQNGIMKYYCYEPDFEKHQLQKEGCSTTEEKFCCIGDEAIIPSGSVKEFITNWHMSNKKMMRHDFEVFNRVKQKGGVMKSSFVHSQTWAADYDGDPPLKPVKHHKHSILDLVEEFGLRITMTMDPTQTDYYMCEIK